MTDGATSTATTGQFAYNSVVSFQITITDDLLADFYRHNILFKWNSPPPQAGSYGWLKSGAKARFSDSITIEENSGLYRGPYRGLVGGKHSSGLVSMGAFSYSYSPLPDGVTVGRYCSISSGLRFLDSTHPLNTITTSALLFRPRNDLFRHHQTTQLRDFSENFTHQPQSMPQIGHDVWIGADVTLSPNVSIGTGAVIAANSVVTKDVQPYSIMGGNPARPIKSRFSERISSRLIQSEWWDYDPAEIFSQTPTEIESILRLIETTAPKRLSPRAITIAPNNDPTTCNFDFYKSNAPGKSV